VATTGAEAATAARDALERLVQAVEDFDAPRGFV
jgi:hypothetical protein